MSNNKTLLPLAAGSRLGVLGGGQLGAYFVRAAQNLGFKTAVLCPDSDSPAMQCTDLAICAAFDDEVALEQLSDVCDGITTEFENVPAKTLANLTPQVRVYPQTQAVSIAQNRILEKQHFKKNGLSTTPFVVIEAEEDWLILTSDSQYNNFFPAILKTATLGYDGKSQWQVNNIEEGKAVWRQHGALAGVLEKRCTLIQEISIILVRATNGVSVCYPVVENIHHQGILAMTIAPAPNLSTTLTREAKLAALKLAESLDYIGVMGVEFFITDAGLMINEMAPRPHNSGHYSLSACTHSQFEQQVRVLAGWSVASTNLHSNAVMINILGDSWFAQNRKVNKFIQPNWQVALQNPMAELFLYGKNEVKIGRKMGHITLTSPINSSVDINELKRQAQVLAEELGIVHI